MTDFEKVAIDDLPDAPNPARHKKEVDEAVGATEFGFNVYEAAPGQRIPWGYHRHPNHEELFYVLSGALDVEMADETVRVEANEALFLPPDTLNVARAVGEEPARVVAVGAPKDSDEAIIEEACPECSEIADIESEDLGGEYVLRCGACGAEIDRLTAGPE